MCSVRACVVCVCERERERERESLFTAANIHFSVGILIHYCCLFSAVKNKQKQTNLLTKRRQLEDGHDVSPEMSSTGLFLFVLFVVAVFLGCCWFWCVCACVRACVCDLMTNSIVYIFCVSIGGKSASNSR